MAAVIEMLDQISGEGTGAVRSHLRAVHRPGQITLPRNDDSECLCKMRLAFGPTGGVLSGDAFSVLLRERSDQPISLLARWIVRRQIVSFEAHGQRWLPMFQFERDTLCVNVPTRDVIFEMRDVFDDWELTEWFASPNAWLDGDYPAHAIGTDVRRVYETARADRFVAAGY